MWSHFILYKIFWRRSPLLQIFLLGRYTIFPLEDSDVLWKSSRISRNFDYCINLAWVENIPRAGSWNFRQLNFWTQIDMRKNVYTVLLKLFQLRVFFFFSSQFKTEWMFVCWKEEAGSFTSKFNAVIIMRGFVISVQFSSFAQSCPTLCDPMDCSTPGFPVHHQLPELAQTHVHWVNDATQPSRPLSSPSPPAFNLSQHQCLVQWVSSLHRVPKYWGFSFSISPSKEYSGLISFRMDLVHLWLSAFVSRCAFFVCF